MSVKFHFDVIKLIKLVEERPCLWNKTCKLYKDQILKKNMWRDIYINLQPNFETLKIREQEKLGESIINKWHNIRDSFVRSLRNRPGKVKSRRYLYHEQLQFLLNVIQKADTESSLVETNDDVEESEDIQPCTDLSRDQENFRYINKRKTEDNLEKEILEVLNKKSQIFDEDTSFFNSLLPSVRGMTEDEKIEFRMGVLQLIKEIKQSRGLTPYPIKVIPMQNKYVQTPGD